MKTFTLTSEYQEVLPIGESAIAILNSGETWDELLLGNNATGSPRAPGALTRFLSNFTLGIKARALNKTATLIVFYNQQERILCPE